MVGRTLASFSLEPGAPWLIRLCRKKSERPGVDPMANTREGTVLLYLTGTLASFSWIVLDAGRFLGQFVRQSRSAAPSSHAATRGFLAPSSRGGLVGGSWLDELEKAQTQWHGG